MEKKKGKHMVKVLSSERGITKVQTKYGVYTFDTVAKMVSSNRIDFDTKPYYQAKITPNVFGELQLTLQRTEGAIEKIL